MARPREFDPAKTLESIKSLFWSKGFEGSSLQDLEEATGLNRQSLYRAFGDKRAMYLAALADYERREVAGVAQLLSSPGSARERFAFLFETIITDAVISEDRRGCFLCNASVEQFPPDAEARAEIGAALGRVVTAFNGVLAKDPGYTDATLRARRTAHIVAVYMGIRVLMKSGAGRDMLLAAASGAIEAI